MGEFSKGLVFYFINHVLNKLPSRRVRSIIYWFLSDGRISRKAYVGLGVRMLNIKGIEIGCGTNINYGSILDGRGMGLSIGCNVDLAPQVNVWTLEHDPRSPNHNIRSQAVIIGDGCWLANRVIILPGTVLPKNNIVGAGTLVKGVFDEDTIISGSKGSVVGKSFKEDRASINSIRVFR